MNLRHEEVLADIERRVRTNGATIDEVDAAIAAELGVPADYYFAYLLVWGAIEAYRHAQALTDLDWPYAPVGHDEAVAACRGQVDRVGLLGAQIYRHAVELGAPAAAVADRAGEVLGAVVLLRKHLHELGADPAPPPPNPGGNGNGNGQAVTS